MAQVAARLISSNMSVEEPQLSPLWSDIGIRQVHPAVPDGLYLRAGESDARLKAVQYVVIMVSPAVGGYRLCLHIPYFTTGVYKGV
jgi:hypothetical protein